LCDAATEIHIKVFVRFNANPLLPCSQQRFTITF
jgi:hypothetical protein